MLSCLLGLLLLVMAWPRAAHGAQLWQLASAAHATAALHHSSQGDANDDITASPALEDNCGMDDMLHLPGILGLGLIPAGSDALATSHYAVRQRDIAQLLRPPEAA
jgi:hypothetical protein